MTQASSKPGSVSIGRYDDLRQKERVVLDIDGTSVGVYFIGDEIRAWHNTCPHSGGPVCQGKTVPRTLQGVEEGTGKSLGLTLDHSRRMIVCPWHGFEFDLLTGIHAIDERTRLRPVPVALVDGDVVLTLG
ncbi:MAG: Rieske 2Fe-2S domain-containing protein [Rhodobacter sp.]|nr:Rieske 2Fe-2S domain-containing protein [Paracoccaceae bacterium]MCC0077092.1 Rieske 2Fe-2S domain-containing protein [Rhodobacter sp.]